MELIHEITDKDFKLGEGSYFGNQYKIRKASRIVIFNEKNEIALINVSKRGYHKLPGGGLEDGEDILEALKREVLEEVGCHVKIDGKLGMILEYKNDYFQLQISYCYIGRKIGFSVNPSYTESEMEKGMTVVWVPINEVLGLMENACPENYTDKFILKRDLAFLKKLLKN